MNSIYSGTGMTARAYKITLIHKAGRIVRNVIAHQPFRATQIGIGMMPEVSDRFIVICKPAPRQLSKGVFA